MADARAIPLPKTTWRDQWQTYAPRLRYWLIPALVAMVVLAPLMRNGLPVTQLGLLPTNPGMADLMDKRLSVTLLPFNLLTLGYPATLAFFAVAIAGMAGVIASRLWQGHGWWVAALALTFPFLISAIYQRGTVELLTAWAYLLLFIFVALPPYPQGNRARWLLPTLLGINAVFLLVQVAYSGDSQPLAPYQLFLAAWAEPLNLREWVGAPSFQIGVVPLGLALLTVLAALPRRHERPAQVVLGLMGSAALLILLTLFSGPVPVWLILALTMLMVGIGALPLLDNRYAAPPVQIGIVAIALLTIYPYLQPAWFDDSLLNAPSENSLFGEEQLWLARTTITREGDAFTVAAAWQALEPIAQNYSVFVHFVNAEGAVVAQADALLMDGANVAASQWAEGYVAEQRYTATVSEPIQEIRLGVYDGATLQRLPIATLYRYSNSDGTPTGSWLQPNAQDYLSFTTLP